MERLEAKIDRLDERQDRMEILMEKNTVILEEHMRRTKALEEIVKPIHYDHLAIMRMVRIFSWSLGVLGGLAGLYKLLF
jgi:hypothetical protein